MTMRRLAICLGMCCAASAWAGADVPDSAAGADVPKSAAGADVPNGAGGAAPRQDPTDAFGFGRSESELVKSVPGLACGVPETDLWGGADRSCLTEAEVFPDVGAMIIFNLRHDRLVSTVLVIDQSELGTLLTELTKRHGPPDGAFPSIIDPEKVVWVSPTRALIVEKTLPGLPQASSLLVSPDPAILDQARALLTHPRPADRPGELTAK